jgi:hypothetical protein
MTTITGINCAVRPVSLTTSELRGARGLTNEDDEFEGVEIESKEADLDLWGLDCVGCIGAREWTEKGYTAGPLAGCDSGNFVFHRGSGNLNV